MSTWIVTGCSSGLGAWFARAALAAGHQVVVTARGVDSVSELVAEFPERAIAAALDITSQAQVDAVVALALRRFGRIDVLVNNAGYGLRTAVEEAGDDEIAQVMDVNFRGTVRMIQAVLPHMRAQRSGTIVNITSIAARRTAPGSGFYSASKAAIESVSDALRKEVGPLGIRVSCIEPGAFRTDFAGRSLQGSRRIIADYQDTVGPRRKGVTRVHGTQPGDPQKAANVLLALLEREQLPFRLLLGRDAVTAAADELSTQRDELEAWRAVSLGTDFSTP